MKHKVLPLGKNYIRHKDMLGTCSWKSSLAEEKDLGVFVDSEMANRQQCALAA